MLRRGGFLCTLFLHQDQFPDNIWFMEPETKRCIVLFVLIATFLLCASGEADASDRNRFTAKPGSLFCRSLAAIRTLQNSLSRKDGKAASLLNSQECSVSPTAVVVYVVHEEEDMARVQLVNSGKYLWISKQSLR
jgi:hypothetical protein